MKYVTYLAGSHAGIGETREESQERALYWHNQSMWVRTVPISRAPQWAVNEAMQALEDAKNF